MYKCQCFPYNSTKKQFDSATSITLTSLEVTALANNILQKANVRTSQKWQGQTFFGLNQQAVCQLLDSSIMQFQKNSNAFLSKLNMDCTTETNIYEDDSETMRPQKILWLGVDTYGHQLREFTHNIAGQEIYIPHGYQSRQQISVQQGNTHTPVEVTCRIENDPCTTKFICSANSVTYSSSNPTKSMRMIFEYLKFVKKRNISGYEFFGLQRKDVINRLLVKPTLPSSLNPALVDIINIQKRNGGPTSSMSSQRNQDLRNQKIHNIVDMSSFGDCKSYVGYLLKNFPNIVLESIKENNEFQQQLPSILTNARVLDTKQSASLLMSWTTLTQREYNSVRQILKNNNVDIAKYCDVSVYLKTLNVGQILTNYCKCENSCMSAATDIKETLCQYLKSEFWMSKMNFNTNTKSLIHHLQNDSSIYKHLNPDNKCIFLRMTGDNFRAACKQPTQQISFSILNVQELVNSPYGQILSSIFRGKETRKNIDEHVTLYHQQLEELLKEGLKLDSSTAYNIIPILCADLGYVKELLGKCSTTSLYGCYYCKKPIQKWHLNDASSPLQTIVEMSQNGKKGVECLGLSPDHDSKIFTEFQQSHYGQYAPPLFKGLSIICMPPCSLHLILAIHRYLWAFQHLIIVQRDQIGNVKSAFQAIGCSYLALQYDSYFASKDKHYDGSKTLKMIGQDCKNMEALIDKFVINFLKNGEDINSKSAESLRHIITLYRLFADIAIDLRETTYSESRCESFQDRVNYFIVKFSQFAMKKSLDGKPYLHILKEHISMFMKFWGQKMEWGYGMFSCTASEHLNKRIKCMEFGETNLKDNRFATIIQRIRVKQLHFPDHITKKKKNIVCSACHEIGHNRKNKQCPLHATNITIEFSDSEDEC